MKRFYVQERVGSARYLVSFHNGSATHRDGSPFYDIAIFRNKRKLAAFVAKLKSEGYAQ